MFVFCKSMIVFYSTRPLTSHTYCCIESIIHLACVNVHLLTGIQVISQLFPPSGGRRREQRPALRGPSLPDGRGVPGYLRGGRRHDWHDVRWLPRRPRSLQRGCPWIAAECALCVKYSMIQMSYFLRVHMTSFFLFCSRATQADPSSATVSSRASCPGVPAATPSPPSTRRSRTSLTGSRSTWKLKSLTKLAHSRWFLAIFFSFFLYSFFAAVVFMTSGFICEDKCENRIYICERMKYSKNQIYIRARKKVCSWNKFCLSRAIT